MVGYVGTHGTNPAVRKVPYDAVRDFTPIAMVGGTPNILVVQPSMPAADLKGVVAHYRGIAPAIKEFIAGQTMMMMPGLAAEIGKALAAKSLQDRLAGEAIEPMPMTSEQFGRFIQAELVRWGALARERKISLDD